MRCVNHFSFRITWLIAGLLAGLVAGCGGGGDSSVTTITGAGTGVATVSVAKLTGPNVTDIVVDSGPASFSLGAAANIPYVTVTVCAPGSTTACTTIDHVFLDTGSYGLRLFKGSVGKLSLPPVMLPVNGATPAGTVVECYPFVLGGLWGPLAKADVKISGETAPSVSIQVIDDTASNLTTLTPPADCKTAAGGTLFNSAASLQANAILGIGMIDLDCGSPCSAPSNLISSTTAGFHFPYYVCPDGTTAHCQAAAVPDILQVQNPVAHFVPLVPNGNADDNGSIITLPALPKLGAGVATGRLVFGIGTQSNNQPSPSATVIRVETNPASLNYLYFNTTVGPVSFPESYIDSGSNAYFFDDATISKVCKSASGAAQAGWYCPVGAPIQRSATLTGATLNGVPGNTALVNFSIDNADILFNSATGSTAFSNLGGSLSQAPSTFVWGLSFFYGRDVYTSIWGKQLSANGPWNAF